MAFPPHILPRAVVLRHWMRDISLAAASLGLYASVTHAKVLNETLCGHNILIDDGSGQISPWPLYSWPGPDEPKTDFEAPSLPRHTQGCSNPAFSALLQLTAGWFSREVPLDERTGLPLYYFFDSFKPSTDQGNPWPATPGSMVMFVTQAALGWYYYSGSDLLIRGDPENPDPKSRVFGGAIPFARYVLANGTTASDPSWKWPSMPYASSDPGAYTFVGANSSSFGGHGRGDGIGVIEPDKAADAGKGFALLGAYANDKDLMQAAIAVADTLAANVRKSPNANGTQSPWPFRVHAQSGQVEEQYTSNVISAVELFDILLAYDSPATPLGAARTSVYTEARTAALEWQKAYPEKNNKWTACCEDVPIDNTLDNYNSVQSLFAAQYIIKHKEDREDWIEAATSIISFVEGYLIYGPSNTQKMCDAGPYLHTAYGGSF
eukprot:gene2342-3169_t